MLNSLKNNHGLDVAHIINNGALTIDEKRKAIAPLYNQAFPENTMEADQISAVPNLFISSGDVHTIRDARGSEISSAVTYYYNVLALASEETDPAKFAALTVGAGVIAIGTPMAIAVGVALKAGAESLLAAAKIALSSVGMWVAVIAAVVLIVLEILIYLASITREIFGLVVNNLSYPLYVKGWDSSSKDLYVKHGEIKTFMYDLQEAYNIAGVMEGGLVPLGFVGGQKNFGFLGIEAMMVLRSKDDGSSDPGLAVQFCNPYSRDTGVNITTVSGAVPDMSALYDTLYSGRGIGPISTTGNGATGTVTANSDSGKSAYFTLLIDPA